MVYYSISDFWGISQTATKVKEDNAICVIMVADVEAPTAEMVTKAFSANDHGAGAAWRENGVVKWRKGLDLEEMQALAAVLPIPHVLHFRIASCGGKSPFLCHPFPVEENVPLDLEGETLGYVLFHNGHWGAWKDKSLESAVRRNHKIPGGKWSDTRAMAMMAHHYGLGVLDLIDEKAVAFGPEGIEMYSTWYKLNNVWCSNLGFNTTGYMNNRTSYHGVNNNDSWEGGGYSSSYPKKPDDRLPAHYAGAKKDEDADKLAVTKLLGDGKTMGGSSPVESFRTGDGSVEEGAAQQQKVEEGPKEVREVAVEGEGAQAEGGPGGPAKEQRRLGVDANVPLVQLASDEDLSLLRWSRSLNPKKYRSSGEKGINGSAYRGEKDDRARDRERGIERIGPM